MNSKIKYVYDYRQRHVVGEDNGLNYLVAEKTPVACIFMNPYGDIGVSVCSKNDRMCRRFAREVAEIRSYKNRLETFLDKINDRRKIVNKYNVTVSLKDQIIDYINKMKEYAESKSA